MIIFLILFLLLCVWKMKFSKFNEGYIGKDSTTSIKGIFAIIILFSHLCGYVSISNSIIDRSFASILGLIGQLMVVIFFFYSGYGIIQSYKSKPTYPKSFFRCRILKTLTHFDIAVFFYLILSLAMTLFFGQSRPWEDYAFAWIGWTSLGNSNWFIFITLLLYAITLLSFFIAEAINKHRELLTTIFVSILSVAAYFLLAKFKESYWYDTLFCYACGMWFALLADKMNALFKAKPLFHYGAIAASILLFFGTYVVWQMFFSHPLLYNIVSCAFCIALVLITTVVKIQNPVLLWLGKYSFLIYILQRLPMVLLSILPFAIPSYLFAILAIIATLALSFVFNFFYEKIDKKLFTLKKPIS